MIKEENRTAKSSEQELFMDKELELGVEKISGNKRILKAFSDALGILPKTVNIASNRYVFFLSILFAVALSACTAKKTDDNIVFKNIEHLHADTIQLQNIFDPIFVTLTNGVLTFTSYQSSPMLHFYETPSLKYLYSTGIKGKGPSDIQIFPMICRNTSSDTLYIWGYTPVTIKSFSVYKDSLSLVKTYNLNNYETFNNPHIIRDSIFLYSNSEDMSIKKCDLETNLSTGKLSFKTDSHGQSAFSENYGLFAANDSLIIYAYQYKKQIDIYDIASLQLKTRIIDKYEYEPPTFNYTENVLYYISIVAENKYFYVMYRGRNSENVPLNNDIIEVFDYDGNPVVKYIFEDIAPQIFTVDEINHYIYGYSYNNQDYLLRYAISSCP
ncbi:MAG: TolB-like 6-bladed beta-propeller domain-containing protein [Prevotellaceae bacterium]|jgi:hypothetical protein|nr:TolB-like 6-bladed beta-propeller domain-containing protein [Prevotellaceae bacterium]